MSDSEFTEVVRGANGEILGLKKHRVPGAERHATAPRLPSPNHLADSDYGAWERLVEAQHMADCQDAFNRAFEIANARLQEAAVPWRFRVTGVGAETEIALDQLAEGRHPVKSEQGAAIEAPKARGFGFGRQLGTRSGEAT